LNASTMQPTTRQKMAKPIPTTKPTRKPENNTKHQRGDKNGLELTGPSRKLAKFINRTNKIYFMNEGWIVFIASVIAGVLSFTVPWYVSPEAYIPKRIPQLGYFMPKTPTGWFFVALGLAFFAIALISAYKLKVG
jgi:hypothetical protein